MGIPISQIEKTRDREFYKGSISKASYKSSFFISKKINDKKRCAFYKDLGTLLKAGVDFKTALTIIRDQQTNQHIKQIIADLLEKVIKGKALFQAMTSSKNFSQYEIFSVQIGEETRNLESITKELESYFERKIKLRKQIISMLAYPGFILVLTFGTLYFMLKYVVPMFETVFKQFDKELPALTKNVIFLSEKFNTIFLVFILIIITLILVYKKIKHKTIFRKYSTGLLLKIPFVSQLLKQVYLTRFCQSLALLLVSKTSLVESLSLVQKMISFYPIEYALEQVKVEVTKGKGLGESLSKFKVFDVHMVSMLTISERVNELDTMFLNLAQHYEAEVEHKTKLMGTIIEPLLIVFIGGIVGLIMVSMYAPMFDLSKVIGSG